MAGQDPLGLLHIFGPADLGQDHGLHPRAGHGLQVGLAPGGVQAVAAHGHFARAKAALAQHPHGGGPRLRLGLGRDGVLQVEHHHVARQAARLLHRPGIDHGQVKHAAAAFGGAHDSLHPVLSRIGQ